MLPASLHRALCDLLGPRLSTEASVCQNHSRDASYHMASAPPAVAFPRSEAEVAALVGLCAREKFPLIPFGTGTAVEGGIVAVRPGLCVDLSLMDEILAVHAADMDAVVQAGVTRNQLNRHLEAEGTDLFFPVDPGADASLGGMAATRASGSTAVGYGTMRENVLGLRTVMADGTLVSTGGRARKSSAGYDLTRLLVGSEGTLGIITGLTLRLRRRPRAIAAAACHFPRIEAAVDAVIEILGRGVSLARIELLDEVQMRAVNRYSHLDYRELPTLFFEFHGTPGGVSEEALTAGEVVRQQGGSDFRWTVERSERERLWQARYDAYYAALELRPGASAYITDVCVPVSALAECIRRTRQALAQTAFIAPLFGHVGDGNFHLVCLVDPADPAELEAVRALGRQIVSLALELGGTCSGEHGIGLGKIEALEEEAGASLEIMRAIKRALDPHNILNPGKVLRC